MHVTTPLWASQWVTGTQYQVLPAEGAGEAAVEGPASQAAGTEGVVAVQQAGLLVLLVAQVAH